MARKNGSAVGFAAGVVTRREVALPVQRNNDKEKAPAEKDRPRYEETQGRTYLRVVPARAEQSGVAHSISASSRGW